MNTKKENKNATKIMNYYYKCFFSKRKNALDMIIGHVHGGRLACSGSGSPWISFTDDLDMAIAEYAVPQAGNFNKCDKRKPVILIQVPNDRIYSDATAIKALGETYEDDFGIDLTDGNLATLYSSEAIDAEKYNPDLPGYKPLDKMVLWRTCSGERTSINGLSNYAKYSSEILIYNEVKKENIKLFIFPLLEDIIYSCDIDLVDYSDLFIDNADEFNKFLVDVYKYYSAGDKFYKALYPGIIDGINLTDYLVANYNQVLGRTLVTKYEALKEQKMKLIINIVDAINNHYHTRFSPKRLVDDKIYVSDYECLPRLTKNEVNDLIVISKDDVLYKYDSQALGYISGEEVIKKTKVKTLAKGRF